jgi:hypothetical protein
VKLLYFIWFFVCSGWGYLLAQPAPANFVPPSSTALMAFPAGAFWIFVLMAVEAWRAGPHRRLSPPSLSLKPWVMPTGVLLFVLLTFLFASTWGLAFAAFLPAASAQVPIHFFALSSGGVVGLWVVPRVFPSKFHA